MKDFATKAFAYVESDEKSSSFSNGPKKLKNKNLFDDVKQALMEVTALVFPASEGKFVLDTDASTVGISRNPCTKITAVEWRTVLRPVYYPEVML